MAALVPPALDRSFLLSMRSMTRTVANSSLCGDLPAAPPAAATSTVFDSKCGDKLAPADQLDPTLALADFVIWAFEALGDSPSPSLLVADCEGDHADEKERSETGATSSREACPSEGYYADNEDEWDFEVDPPSPSLLVAAYARKGDQADDENEKVRSGTRATSSREAGPISPLGGALPAKATMLTTRRSGTPRPR